MKEYERGSQCLYSRAGGSTGKKLSDPWKGEDKADTHRSLGQNLVLLQKVMLVINIVRNIHSISYFCFILVTTD